MKLTNHKQNLLALGLITGTALLGGCNDSSYSAPDTITPPPPPPPITFTFDVTVTNLTNAQPLSPVGVIAHEDGNIWTLNESASEALELLAEGGDNSSLLAESYVLASASGQAPVGPGGSETISITLQDTLQNRYLSLATMLVNTNDAFSGKNKLDISQFEVGTSQSMMAAAYDAGTEFNSETMGTMPGPADGGEGFNSIRDDVDFVARHSGVVTSDFGLSSSVLTEAHRFDNPVIKITVTRMQ